MDAWEGGRESARKGRGRGGREGREVRRTGIISALHLRVLPGLEAAEGLGSSARPGAVLEITLAIIRAALPPRLPYRHLEEEPIGSAWRRASVPAAYLRSTEM